jgi:cytochrome bd-type quinol oxidase subunit 2
MKIITRKQYFYATGVGIITPILFASVVVLGWEESLFWEILVNLSLFIFPLVFLCLFLYGIFLAKKSHEHRQSFIIGSVINIIFLFFLLWILSGFLVHTGQLSPTIIYPSTDEV